MAMIKKPVNKQAVMAARALAAKRVKAAATRKKRRIRQTLDRFVVLATSLGTNSTPKDSSGWTATLKNGATTVNADFDDFGVARFPTISTLTTVPYLLTIRDENGVVLKSFNVPAEREFFVARF
ncbi:MAG TPA: hypothetical protein DEA91_16810 [Paenibacillus sp.]|nr:hypothetical protein [Paenibacillus sp.]